MDTVSMLNTMHFYCQPILPLVYDESLSYYETLCKVVGQLNTTGETVNKLNEGLTGEIADRQAADAALDARIKQIEETNRKIHFLKVDTLGHLLTPDVTREKLSQWVQNGELITMLYAPDELENSWAVATNYRSMGATDADTMQLNFYVPVSITHNAGKSGLDTVQEIVVISLPTGALTNQWVVRSITNTIPDTNADGFVNLTASVSDAGAVTCDVEPGAIIDALRNAYSGTNQYAVAVNARLTYDRKQYHAADATVKSDVSGTGNVRIAFENYYDGVRTENGVRQTTNTTVFLVGDAKTRAWSVETIDYKTFDFSRYEGFQFTRGANNVITTNDEATPNAVYAQYHSDTSGKLYQNLPTRLIDSVDGAEYWNGTFDIYGGNHMTFTFVTSNYATASDKMLVRVIELSADVGTTAWKYGVKEFTLPLSGGGATTYVDFWGTGQSEVYENDLKAWTIALATNQTFDAIYDLISSGADVVARLYKDSTKAELVAKSIEAQLSGDKTLGNINFLFVHAASDVFLGFSTIADAIWVTKTTTGTSAYALYKWCTLPVPAGDSSDNGKVPTVNGTEWEMKTPTGGGSADAVLYTPQTLTDEQKKQARMNVDAAIGDFQINATVAHDGAYTLDKTYPEIVEAINGGKKAFVRIDTGSTNSAYLPLVAFNQNAFHFSAISYDDSITLYADLQVRDDGVTLKPSRLVKYVSQDTIAQVNMETPPAFDAQVATKKYVDDNKGSADAVRYTEQALTEVQQSQARKNIGALGNVSPNIKNLMIITPPNEADGIGVSLAARGTGGNFTLDISDANEGQPTKLLGVKTPIDAETHAATTVEYVLGKIANVPVVPVDAVMSDTSTHAVENNVIKKYVDDSAAKKLNQTEPVIKDGLTIESGSFAVYAQPNGQTSATGEDFASLNFSDSSPQGGGAGIVISGLANFGDAEAVGLEDTAVSYAQLVEYTTPLTLTYANNQVTGASYADIRKAITRGRQIKLAVANMPDVIVTNAKNETDRSVLSFIDTSVGGDTVDFTQYSVVAQASGITATVKSMQLP